MTTTPSPRHRKAAQLLAWFSTGRDGTRPDPQLEPQLGQSTSFNLARPDRGEPLIQRDTVKHCAGSSRHLSDVPSAALKSP
jgi:hypothetical protein